MGPNGAGKSTLALTLAGLLKPIAGKVLIADNLKPAHAGREPIDWKSKELLGPYRHGVCRARTPVRCQLCA